MSIAVHASRRGRLVEDDVVVVMGTGGIGSFITFAAAATGATVVAVDIDPSRLKVATALGASTAIDASSPVNLSDRIVAEVGAPTLVFECTAIADSPRTVSDNGRVVVVGHQPQPFRFDFKQVSFGEIEVIGTMAHVFESDFGAAIELIDRNPEVWVRVAPTVHPLESLLTAGLIPMVEGRQDQIKTLFDPSVNEPRPLLTNR